MGWKWSQQHEKDAVRRVQYLRRRIIQEQAKIVLLRKELTELWPIISYKFKPRVKYSLLLLNEENELKA